MQSRIEDIAREAGVSHGTVFVHFKSQEELTEAVVSYYGGEIAARTHELSESGGSLEEVLHAHLMGIGMYESFYTRLLLEARLLPQAARDSFVLIQSVLSLHFSRALKREEAAARTGIQAHVLFSMWVGLLHHYLQNGDLFSPEGGIIARHGIMLIDSYLRLLNVERRSSHEDLRCLRDAHDQA
jgi:AcrR family transcriptional regulator